MRAQRLPFIYYRNNRLSINFPFSQLTDKLSNSVVFSLCADRSCDAVVLKDRQEELNKV